MAKPLDPYCSIARSLGVIGEKWTFLILREAMWGTTRFADFQRVLGVAPDVLTARLATLVEYGVLAREPYQEPGQRVRDAYVLTPAGEKLEVVLGALQQWGDDHLPREGGPTVVRRSRAGHPLRLAFVDEGGAEVPLDEVTAVRTDQFPSPPG